ncbi:PRD domain-containing protein [Sporolactobacillus sp. CQH2019]|uniref:BglG family transcription antiterminator n=1 Tax=Sporolactobacillus sp. CQH2019 TaxID=3023512 RepID=UPI0023689044|nr:PRD domain-containing protein [Sporolactobacillus sp. CQH2019]MDD9147908.1 PRD domain-containing protein [Sporolactobacillus sp. CQH2019]
MFITNREKTILELLIKTGGRHTSLSIATYLQVSVRTIHRDLKKLESSLAHFGLKLQVRENGSLYIDGSDEAIFKLVQTLSKVQPLDLSVKERKLLLLLNLLGARGPMKTGPLAKDLGVSVTTLHAYLDELADWIGDFDLEISRKRGVGVQLEGSESAKRKALGSFFLFYFNEELIEAIFQLSGTDRESDKLILHYFKADYLVEIERAIKEDIGKMYAELADSDYVGFMIQVCITLQRFESGFFLTKDDAEHERSDEREALPLIEKISRVFAERLSITLSEPEKTFLTVILKGSHLQDAESVYYDSVITGKAVKKLIQHVSRQLNIDLTGDFSLFQGLMAHLEPSLFRIRKNLGSFNPLTEQVRKQYPALFSVTGSCLEEVFKHIAFPDDEVAYVVLHFGSALEQRKQIMEVRTLVVCPTGIGASKMLATRLEKEMPELLSVTIASIKKMGQMDLKNFDLILSTVHLPRQEIPCIFVNPLLSKENIAEIHEAIGQSTKKKIRPVYLSQNKKGTAFSPQKKPSSLYDLIDQIDAAEQAIRKILKNFSVMRILNADSMETVIKPAVDQIFRSHLIRDAEAVYQKLLAREKMAGLGIPGTNMALFHCRDQSIQTLSFQIAHSDRPVTLKGMDGRNVNVSNFLLLLVPEHLTLVQQEVVSTISSSLAEDRESTLIFASANERVIRTKMEETFYQFLLNKFTKD